MDEFLFKIKNKKKPYWILTIAFLIFEGGFNFPLKLNVPTTVIDSNSLMIFLVASIIIGIIFAGLIEMRRFFIVFFLTLLCTLIGMGFRYLLEFGEVSNTVNFTKTNIFVYLLIVPIWVTVVFWVTQKLLKNQKK